MYFCRSLANSIAAQNLGNVKCFNSVSADGFLSKRLETSCMKQPDPSIHRNPTASTNSSNHPPHRYLILSVNLCDWAYTGRRYETTPCLCEADIRCCWILWIGSWRLDPASWLRRLDSVPNNFSFLVSLFVWAVILALPAALRFLGRLLLRLFAMISSRHLVPDRLLHPPTDYQSPTAFSFLPVSFFSFPQLLQKASLSCSWWEVVLLIVMLVCGGEEGDGWTLELFLCVWESAGLGLCVFTRSSFGGTLE